MEIVAGSWDGDMYAWPMSETTNYPIPWPQHHHDTYNSGLYEDTTDYEVSCIPGQLIGDADNDGQVTTTDSYLVQEIIAYIILEPPDTCCIDVNQDGTVSIADAVIIQNMANGSVPLMGSCHMCTSEIEHGECLDFDYCDAGDFIGNRCVACGCPEPKICETSFPYSTFGICMECGDANADGVIDQNDVDYIVEIISNISPIIFFQYTDVNGDEVINILDATAIGAYLNHGIPLNCLLNICGDADGSDVVDLDDVVYLIAYIFTGGPAPEPLETGDADGLNSIDLDDVVYLIAYIFTGGPEPVCGDSGSAMNKSGDLTGGMTLEEFLREHPILENYIEIPQKTMSANIKTQEIIK
ncbi:MAG: dockerin type I repeat-containing protein [Candidatus Omnitrophota bacterium]